MDLASAATALRAEAHLCGDRLYLGMGECTLSVRSNSARLLAALRRNFVHVAGKTGRADLEVLAIECDAPDLDVAFADWAREPGKSGRKDAYFDLPGGRLVRKVRTGMLFLQSESERIAAGPCLKNQSQVINFINAQYMNWLQQRDWLICHASGLVFGGRCLAIAGLSGGGKSTLMLHLLEHEGVSYLTNDRLFIRRREAVVHTRGIPKLPRINPGTIVHNARLHRLIEAQERERLLALPTQELWELEQKYDVDVAVLYGPEKITPSAPLGTFLILNWQHNSEQPLQVNAVNLDERRDLLGAIMKSPGPFYQYADGSFYRDTGVPDERAYLDELQGITIYEASGGINFAGLVQRCLNNFMG